jgi:hypothetical protein
MQRYRPYRFCMLHATASAEIIECADDDDAKRRAREIIATNTGYRAVEVWDKEGLVYSYPPKDSG